MTTNVGTLVIDAIVPNDSADTYPTHYDVYGQGGFRVVSTTTDMNNITTSRRKPGMLVYVTANSSFYQLAGDNVTFNQTNIPSGSYATLTALAAASGAGLVGTTDGVTVQAGLTARPKTTDLADPTKGAFLVANAPVIFSNIAAMTAASAPTLVSGRNYSYETLGFYTPGTGGNTFYWDNTSTETPVAGVVIQLTGVVTGRFIAKNRYNISMLQVGALSDQGASDSSSYAQAAIDYLAAAGGGVLISDYGYTFQCRNIVLKNGVTVMGGPGPYGYLPGSIRGASRWVNSITSGWVITSNSGVSVAGVVGMSFSGAGAAQVSGGVHLLSPTWCTISHCSFDNFGEQALYIENPSGNCFACTVEDILITSGVMNRTRVAPIGACQIQGTDHYLSKIEANCNLVAPSSGSLYIAGIYIQGSNSFCNKLVGEFSDIGIRFETTRAQVSDCRADTNQGHGYIVNSAQCSFKGCLAQNNSGAGDNLYSGFYIPASSNQANAFTGCVVVTTAGNRHKYGFEDNINGTGRFTRNEYDSTCIVQNYGTGAYFSVGFSGSGFACGNSPNRTSGATPDVTGSTFFIPTDSSPVNVTNFLGGVTGQYLTVLGNSNVTLINGSGILTNTGQSKTLTTNAIYYFRYYNGNWAEIVTDQYIPGSVSFTPGTIAAGAQVIATVTVTGAVLGDIVTGSFSLDVQGVAVTYNVTAANTAVAIFHNGTAGAVTIAAGTVKVRVLK